MKERFSVRLAMVMVAVAMTASCTKDEILSEVKQEPISFFTTRTFEGFEEVSTRSAGNKSNSGLRSVMRSKDGKTLSLKITKEPMPDRTAQATTRGSIVRTSSDIEAIGVSASIYDRTKSYASQECGNFFYDQRFVPGIAREWYWPTNDYRLSFYAYYPYGSSAFTLSSAANVNGIPTYTYTVPEDVSEQADVMTAHALDMIGGQHEPVNLTFRHHCTALKFTVTNSGDDPMTVKSVTIRGVKYSGILRNGTWMVADGVSNFTFECDTVVPSGETVNLTGNRYMFMIPHTLPSGAKIILETAKNTFEATITGTWMAGMLEQFSMDANDAIDYLRFTALEDGTFTLKTKEYVGLSSIAYSLDEGETWVTPEFDRTKKQTIITPTVTAGNSVLWKGKGGKTTAGTALSYASIFSSTCRFIASGSIMSLLYGTGVNNTTLLNDYTFSWLFYQNTNLVDISGLVLPATTLRNYCYQGMFQGCTNLTGSTPELPATTLTQYCYSHMFAICTNLTGSTSELPATTLAENCYQYMFNGCTGLTAAPELPATTLKNFCYQYMFSGCRSLTVAPELPATTLAGYCYNYMFNGCTGLTAAPELPATTLKNYCYQYMFSGCTGLTTAPELPATTLANYCYDHMFYKCSGLTAAPALPVTTLAQYCYRSMFALCTSLTAAPVLPATTLVNYCYDNMFSGCTGLTTAPALPATTLAVGCYQYMFEGTPLTVAPALPATTLSSYCYNYMFSGCKSLTAAPELPALTLVTGCYQSMFRGCSSLNYVKAAFTTTPGSYASEWLSGVPSSGTFYKNADATWEVSGTSGIPTGWTVQTYTP